MIRKLIWTKLRYEVHKLVKENNLNSEKDYKQFIGKLEELYKELQTQWNAKEGVDFTKELLLRRRELKNESSYLINVGSGVVAGLITGIGITIFPFNKLGVYNHIDNPEPLGFLWWFLLYIVILAINFCVFGLFKLLNMNLNPYQTYAQERELEIIEELVKKVLK